MSVIENFAALPVKEQMEFAVALLKTINSENTFTDETKFELVGIEADDLTGGLDVFVSHTDPIAVPRKASWTCGSEEDVEEVPTNHETTYEDYLFRDAQKSFKTQSTEIDGYRVSLEITDADENETLDAEVEAEHISQEDSGIGDYEHFGFKGYDSHPYIAVEGTITKYCDCAITLYVEPIDHILEPEIED